MSQDPGPLYSTEGMQPAVWGPPLWFFLHTISLNYPPRPTPQQQEDYFVFFKSLANVLPCRYCRESYAQWTQNLDFNVFRSRSSLAKWLYDLHNIVNKKLGKPPHHETFAHVTQKYHAFRGGQPKQRSFVVVRTQSS